MLNAQAHAIAGARAPDRPMGVYDASTVASDDTLLAGIQRSIKELTDQIDGAGGRIWGQATRMEVCLDAILGAHHAKPPSGTQGAAAEPQPDSRAAAIARALNAAFASVARIQLAAEHLDEQLERLARVG